MEIIFQIFAPIPLPVGENSPMLIDYGAGWAPELVGIDWRRVGTRGPLGNRTRTCRLSSL
jgi:hypothetical protein